MVLTLDSPSYYFATILHLGALFKSRHSHLLDEYFPWVLVFMYKEWRNISSVKNLIATQKVKKSLFCSKRWRKVPSVVEVKNKPSLQHRPLDFGFNVYTQTGNSKMGPWSPFHESIGLTPFLEKRPKLKVF